MIPYVCRLFANIYELLISLGVIAKIMKIIQHRLITCKIACFLVREFYHTKHLQTNAPYLRETVRTEGDMKAPLLSE